MQCYIAHHIPMTDTNKNMQTRRLSCTTMHMYTSISYDNIIYVINIICIAYTILPSKRPFRISEPFKCWRAHICATLGKALHTEA